MLLHVGAIGGIHHLKIQARMAGTDVIIAIAGIFKRPLLVAAHGAIISYQRTASYG